MVEVLCARHGWEPEGTDCDVAATEIREPDPDGGFVFWMSAEGWARLVREVGEG